VKILSYANNPANIQQCKWNFVTSDLWLVKDFSCYNRKGWHTMKCW